MGTENPHEYCLVEDGIQSILQDEADNAQKIGSSGIDVGEMRAVISLIILIRL